MSKTLLYRWFLRITLFSISLSPVFSQQDARVKGFLGRILFTQNEGQIAGHLVDPQSTFQNTQFLIKNLSIDHSGDLMWLAFDFQAVNGASPNSELKIYTQKGVLKSQYALIPDLTENNIERVVVPIEFEQDVQREAVLFFVYMPQQQKEKRLAKAGNKVSGAPQIRLSEDHIIIDQVTN